MIDDLKTTHATGIETGREASSPTELALGEGEDDGDGRCARFEDLLGIPGGLVVRFSGAMDRRAGSWFFGVVARRVEAGYIRLALDLSGLQWVPSPGIGHLTGILKAIKLRGGRLVLFGIPRMIEQVLQVLGFYQFFEIVDGEAEALTLLRNHLAGLEEPAFPKIFKCPICFTRTRVAKPMRGRCRNCDTVLAVDEHGMASLG